jgi:hypothetical protein
MSRFYSNTGDTLDYVYELEWDTLTIAVPPASKTVIMTVGVDVELGVESS